MSEPLPELESLTWHTSDRIIRQLGFEPTEVKLNIKRPTWWLEYFDQKDR